MAWDPGLCPVLCVFKLCGCPCGGERVPPSAELTSSCFVKCQMLADWENPSGGGCSRHEELKLVLESSYLWAPSDEAGLKRVHAGVPLRDRKESLC